jgi:hypothetical protein
MTALTDAELAAIGRRVLAPLIAGNEERHAVAQRRLAEIRAIIGNWQGVKRPSAACIHKHLKPPQPSLRTIHRCLKRLAEEKS